MARTQVANRQLLDIIAYRKTANYTLAIDDKDALIEMNLAVANTLTVPPDSSVAFPIGTEILISQYGVGVTTITAGAGVTINYSALSLNLANQFSFVTLLKIGTDEWYALGDLEQAAGGSGTFSVTETEIDFGTTPVTEKSFTITNGAITTSSLVMVSPSGKAATGRVGNDYSWETFSFSVVPGTGKFELTANCSNGSVVGKRKILYTYS